MTRAEVWHRAAVGTPVVALYALTNLQHTPLPVVHHALSHDVSCKYCYKSICPEGHDNCLTPLPPESIVEAAWSILVEVGRLGLDTSTSTTAIQDSYRITSPLGN